MWLETTIRISGKVGAWVECETVRKGGEEQGIPGQRQYALWVIYGSLGRPVG